MPKPRPITPAEAKRSLVGRFGKLADGLRQLSTKFGARPYRVFLVWTRWSGDEAGVGDEREVKRVEILPTPRVRSLDSVALSPMHAGVLPTGSVRVDEVSTSLTSDDLMGHALPTGTVDHVPEPYEFFYEVVEDGRGASPPARAKFRLMGVPHLDAENVQWTFMLERMSQDNRRDGTSAIGSGDE